MYNILVRPAGRKHEFEFETWLLISRNVNVSSFFFVCFVVDWRPSSTLAFPKGTMNVEQEEAVGRVKTFLIVISLLS